MTFIQRYADDDLEQWSKETTVRTVSLGVLLAGLYGSLALGGGWGEVLAVLVVAYVGGWVLLVYGALALAKNVWDALTPVDVPALAVDSLPILVEEEDDQANS